MMRPLVHFCVCLVASTCVPHKTAAAVSYEGYHVLAVQTDSIRKAEIIRNMENDVAGVIWMGATVEEGITLAVPPEKVVEFGAKVKGHGLEMILVSENLQRATDITPGCNTQRIAPTPQTKLRCKSQLTWCAFKAQKLEAF
ncbi:hypothetical protein PoB_006364900 [Plakobranchus ocellatus]|uniref:Carboxypeptidase activation peptide domain-containing protein n=1 Tax=Plakobranchus ocellatus TaxID=259542 RepID=A0AAV4CZ90_9GAST|nr:hypothetical protein PoB_006364900 [Plakobranchus ocellatus]